MIFLNITCNVFRFRHACSLEFNFGTMLQSYQPSYLLHDFNIQAEGTIFEAFIEKNLVDIKCLLACAFL
jgi:hypothetical protein